MIQNVLTNTKNIWFFLVLVLFILLTVGEKAANMFLWLVLASMVILNAPLITAKLQRGFN